jgi:hypothetical protein
MHCAWVKKPHARRFTSDVRSCYISVVAWPITCVYDQALLYFDQEFWLLLQETT